MEDAATGKTPLVTTPAYDTAAATLGHPPSYGQPPSYDSVVRGQPVPSAPPTPFPLDNEEITQQPYIPPPGPLTTGYDNTSWEYGVGSLMFAIISSIVALMCCCWWALPFTIAGIALAEKSVDSSNNGDVIESKKMCKYSVMCSIGGVVAVVIGLTAFVLAMTLTFISY